MVYDGTKSGLNASLWAPWFPLLTIEMHLCSIVPGSYMGDIDIGDMFLNFMKKSLGVTDSALLTFFVGTWFDLTCLEQRSMSLASPGSPNCV
jgi:hypothetical protein